MQSIALLGAPTLCWSI
ncbi:hypothetical protein Zm00014a_044498 [Zea mays]|uniref:Uncharacterized protein n=1 Tax=Zea mays TaxID=4577 RepID=A0A3L6FGA9_MAIZE|nr:hypothetical protein Zm00014a_044498 [Zea mays]